MPQTPADISETDVMTILTAVLLVQDVAQRVKGSNGQLLHTLACAIEDLAYELAGRPPCA